MVDQSQSQLQIESVAGGDAPQSEYRVYLEAHPELTAELMKVLVQLYQDPPKESEAAE